MDPVEAKCEEIRNLLKGSKPLVSHDMISVYITRENLLLCSGLFGQHFQRHLPIVHAPSFRLTQTPAILLLAIMTAGACYSNDHIPVSSIISFAMQTLIVIENQPVSCSPAWKIANSNIFKHERYMCTPPLSTIQASVIACSILASSGRETAAKFVFKYFAPNISVTFE